MQFDKNSDTGQNESKETMGRPSLTYMENVKRWRVTEEEELYRMGEDRLKWREFVGGVIPATIKTDDANRVSLKYGLQKFYRLYFLLRVPNNGNHIEVGDFPMPEQNYYHSTPQYVTPCTQL